MQPDAETREQERLAALDRYDILDTPDEEAFDRITRLTRRVFDVPMASVTLVDGHRQWFKSRQGFTHSETSQDLSMCAVAVRQAAPLIVNDTHDDPRFADKPYVTGGMGLRFYAGVPLCTPDGMMIGTLCAMDTEPRNFPDRDVALLTDLAGMVINELELRTLATTDGLTGALSRRAFRDEGARAVALAKRHRHDLTCIMLDLDHFKSVNDTHGHHTGDRLLLATVEACRAAVRSSDVVGRMGGEEFAILLQHTGPEAALDVAEKLRSAIAHIRVDTGNAQVGATASLGIAGLDRSVGDLDALLQNADAALYAAKDDGRNRCVLWRAPAIAGEPGLRRRVLKAGRIAFNGGQSTVDCTVKFLSDVGAGLRVNSTADIPDRFKLHILADDMHRLCNVQSRANQQIEVAFA